MHNVWTTIACRTACAVPRTTQSKPLLQLFNGYAQPHAARPYSCPSLARAFQYLNQSHTRPRQVDQNKLKCRWKSFSTTACLHAKRKTKSPKKDAKRLAGSPSSTTIKSTSQTAKDSAKALSESETRPQQTQLTWRDYDPTGGMPLPNGELSQAEITSIFDKDPVDVEVGNYILSVMHWRRLSGALIDVGLDFPKDSGVDRAQASKGLDYVRTLMPDFDEAAAGQVWVQEESERLQQEIVDKAVRLGLYKPQPEDPPEEEEQQGTEFGRQKTGQSVLQAMRADNERKWVESEAEKKAAEERAAVAEVHSARGPLELSGGVQPQVEQVQGSSGPRGLAVRQAQQRAALQRAKREEWVKKWEERAQISTEEEAPELSLTQRLAPSFVVLLLVLTGCYFLSENYAPPPQSARFWPDTPASVSTLYAITGVLVGSFILSRFPPLWRTYNKYLTLVPAYPYALSLIGASIRHDTLRHLASNLISLWLFSLLLHEDVGRGTFLAIYIASGAVGGFSSLTYNVLRKQWQSYIIGSSGCVLGVVATACALRPNGTLRAFGYELPIATWVFLAVFTGAEAFAAIRGLKTTIDHAGHLGGIAAGLAAGMYLRRKAQLGKDTGPGDSKGQGLAAVREGISVKG